MHAVIVAGGFGKRAAGMTGDRIPKALLPVGGVPIIFRQMRTLRREGVTHLTVLGGHRGELLQPALDGEASNLGLQVRVIIEPSPLGTGGCLTAVEPGSEDTLIVYGDMLFDIAIAPLQQFHKQQRALLTIVAHPNDHPRTSDLIIEQGGEVKAILPYPRQDSTDHRNLVPAGLYLAAPAFFSRLKANTAMDMIREVLPALLAGGERLAAYNTPEYLRDVGSPARHAMAEHDLAAGRVEAANMKHLRPTIFFDCDGVLNEEPGLHGAIAPDDINLIPAAGEALRHARNAGRLTVAITNRSQVAKGFVTFERLAEILGRLEAELAKDGGILDRIYFCPHHPDAGFSGEVPALKVKCECRKPGTLLLERAVAELPIDRKRSVLVGDSLRDIAAAHKFGIWAYGVRTGAGCRDHNVLPPALAPVPDLMFENVYEAVQFDLNYRHHVARVLERLRRSRNGQRTPIFIGLCGRSRGGKSVAAHAIVRALSEDGLRSLHVRLDDWIMPQQERPANCSAETRYRVEAIPSVLDALRRGVSVRATGYDAASRGSGAPVAYDPTGYDVIILDGSFAGHPSIRSMLDLSVFVDVSEQWQRAKFSAFYQWKGLAPSDIDRLWVERSADEWPLVDAQRSSADIVLSNLWVDAR